MPERLTIAKVKNMYSEMTNNKCKILDDEYINSVTKMNIQCKCSNIFQRDWQHIKRGQLYCCDCKLKAQSEYYRFSQEYVENYINSTDCEFISGEYVNSSSKLNIRCKCGNPMIKTFEKFKIGQQRCSECVSKLLSSQKVKYTEQDVIKDISKDGYQLVGKYVDAHTHCDCVCSKGHHFNLVYSQYLQGCSGCSICAHEKQSGQNHWNYKGGVSEIFELMRSWLTAWKTDVLKYYNYQCFLTDSNKNFVIHHITSFNTLAFKVCNSLNIPLNTTVNNLSSDEMDKIKSELMKYHTLTSGIVISEAIHKKFHSIYGYGDNTYEQFKEFVKEYYPNRYDDFTSMFESKDMCA